MQNANKTRGVGPLGGSGMVGLWSASSLVKSVQTGSMNMQAATTANSTITAVDVANSIVLNNGSQYTTDADDMVYTQFYLSLTSSTNVAAVRNSGGGGTITTYYTVIEFRPGLLRSLQSGTITLGGGVASGTATITAVNPLKSLLIFTGNLGSAGTAAKASMFGYEVLTNATTVTLARNSTASGIIASYQVMELF